MTTVMPRPVCPPSPTDAPAPAGVSVGPVVTVVFEDRHALWLKMHEVRRFGRRTLGDADRELDWYRRLMPTTGKWTAAVWVGRAARPDLRAALADARLQLVSSAGHVITAARLSPGSSSRLVGLVGWVEFLSDPAFEAAFAAPGLRWVLRVSAHGYADQSDPLVRAGDGFVAA